MMNATAAKNINKIAFWDRKIIEWDNERYSKHFLSMMTGSVNNRMLMAFHLLKIFSRDKIVVEAGCGTARLMPLLLESGASKYIGIDFSDCAIEAAKERAKTQGLLSRVDLICEDITNFKTNKADLFFSLGLLDWLMDHEICLLLKNIETRHYLHSFSEKKMNVEQLAHRIYVYFKYGFMNKKYTPRYYTREHVCSLFSHCGCETPEYFINRKMSFSCFAHNLPLRLNK
jgi:SAM-dependent methyltransferase